MTKPEESPPPSIPERLPELWVRRGADILDAPPGDNLVAGRYPAFRDKGLLSPTTGERLTIMSDSLRYSEGDEIRIIHVYEATRSGFDVYEMGPKRIEGEQLDGLAATPEPTLLHVINGSVGSSPAVEYNFDVTSYRLKRGIHRIRWRSYAPTVNLDREPSLLSSNELMIEVK